LREAKKLLRTAMPSNEHGVLMISCIVSRYNAFDKGKYFRSYFSLIADSMQVLLNKNIENINKYLFMSLLMNCWPSVRYFSKFYSGTRADWP
jgi:hypothetical protein